MKRLLGVLGFLAALVPVASSAEIYSYTSHLRLDLGKNKSATVLITTTGKPTTLEWDLLKGHCYSHQIASAHNIHWELDSSKRPIWKVDISANRPGFCDMFFNGGGGELRIGITVDR